MQNNVLEYLENIVVKVPNKLAYVNESISVTFREVFDNARAIGTFINKQNVYKKPVVVFMEKSPKAIITFFGVLYSGNLYVPFDEEMPRHRIELILQNLNPESIICDDVTVEILKNFNYSGNVYLYDEIINTEINEEALADIRSKSIDTDPMYIVFTSGSTGVPKGVVACHRSVIDYIENLSEVLGFNEDTVFGNQSPLYFDACLKELYPTLKFGATTYLVPKSLFMFPIKLVEYLNENKINTVCWVVSALTMISSCATFKSITPEHLHTIAFGSEVFPIKQLNIWREALPNAKFTNLYGPTEATGMSCYFKVDREFQLDETVPIGKPFKNTEILLINDNNGECQLGEEGEICIRGTAVTLGYYNNPEKTSEAFTQNPLNTAYPEFIYRTGDIGKYNDRGELLFISRKDYQIKHMGHRIELGEIEVILNMHEAIKLACCIFDDERKKIVLYYTGDISAKDITIYMKDKLPRYMVPNVVKNIDDMPLTANGKINRVFLKEDYINSKKK